MHRMLFVFSVLLCALFSWHLSPAQSTSHLWKAVNAPIEAEGKQLIHPEAFQLFAVNFSALTTFLQQAPQEQLGEQQTGLAFPFPMPDGSTQQIEILQTWVLSENDHRTYPDILTFVGKGIDDPYAYIRLDVTPHGFHGMMLTHGDSYWVDPYLQGNTQYYMAYRKSDVRPRQGEDYSCHAVDPGLDLSLEPPLRQVANLPTGPNLLQYDLAVTCTGEYGQFHGGTKALAQAAIVTSINRVSGVFERDMSIRLVLVPNNDTLVFADPATDPFPCCDLGVSLGIGSNLIDSLIGAANFDIGHTYTTYGGGGAANGVCESDKADGATGLTNPVGDPFDVDYVAHEMGHQFYAGHTFNYCPGPGGIPHEPGSGSTILAYAGLCGTANMQNNSVDAFSVGSYQQSVTYVQQGFGNTCATIIPTGNQAPTVAMPTSGFYIPRSTAFELTANGDDLDGDSLTYSWEQWDFGPNVHPDSAEGDCPLFRVLWPTPDSTRIFPQISDLVQGTQTIGELLPAYGRNMTFRCAVRDNRGGSDFGEMSFFVADSAGPFQLTYPNTGVGFWTAGSIQNIVWDVAQTDLWPVNCASVDVYLSTDGGYTYPILLAANRPNTGSTSITVPQVSGFDMRVKIKGAGNHFFDISNSDFAILPPAGASYSMTVPDPVAAICGQDTSSYVVILDSLGNYSDSISLSLSGLPNGVGYAFSQQSILAPDTVVLTIWNDTAAEGDYTLALQANSTAGLNTMPLSLRLRSGMVAEVSATAPFDGSINVPNSPTFIWNAIAFAQSYHLQVSTSPTFDNLVVDAAGINTLSYPILNPLADNTIYFWRVRVDETDCGSGPWGRVFSFQTPLIECTAYTSQDVPITIPSASVDTVYSTLTVPNSALITDLNVLNLQGEHTWMDDLSFFLISPQNTRVFLFGNQCGDQDDFWLRFDDEALNSDVPCPPTTGQLFQPVEALANFNAEDQQGTWQMQVIDRFAADGGQLMQWGIEICGPVPDVLPPGIWNQLLVMDQGNTETISEVYLQASCNDSSASSILRLISLPQYGTLRLNGQPMEVGDSVYQVEIDAGLLTYKHDSLTYAQDDFQFMAICNDGGYLGGLTFSIQINLSTKTSWLEEVEMKLFPNPTQDAFQVELSGITPGKLGIDLFDVRGKMILKQEGFGTSLEITASDLSPGLYSVVVHLNGEWVATSKLAKE